MALLENLACANCPCFVCLKRLAKPHHKSPGIQQAELSLCHYCSVQGETSAKCQINNVDNEHE